MEVPTCRLVYLPGGGPYFRADYHFVDGGVDAATRCEL